MAMSIGHDAYTAKNVSSDEIYYCGRAGKYWQIYSINIHSKKQKQLTTSGFDKKNPTIWKGRRSIVFQSNNGELYEYSISRRSEKKLDLPYRIINYPSASIRDDRICFSHMREDILDDSDIVLWDMKKGTFLRVTSLRGLEMLPKLLPEEILFLHVPLPNKSAIKSYSISDGKITTILEENALISKFDVSSDGNTIVFCTNIGGDYDLLLFDRKTEKRQPLVKTPFTEDDPDFSPDGNRVVYRSNETGKMSLFIIDLRTREKRCLTSSRIHARQPVW